MSNNINLLPKEIKEDIAQSKKNKRALNYLYKSFFWITITFTIILICWIYYSVQISGISDLINRKEISINKYSEIEIKSKEIADRLKTIKKIDNELYTWPKVLEEIQKAMPSGATLTSLSLNPEKNQRSEITGKAKTKSTVASLRNLLEESEKFEFVNIERSSTSDDVKEGEIESFTITFSLTEGALKKWVKQKKHTLL